MRAGRQRRAVERDGAGDGLPPQRIARPAAGRHMSVFAADVPCGRPDGGAGMRRAPSRRGDRRVTPSAKIGAERAKSRQRPRTPEIAALTANALGLRRYGVPDTYDPIAIRLSTATIGMPLFMAHKLLPRWGTTAAAHDATRPFTAAMNSGVVPQQPPTKLAPAASSSGTKAANSAAVWV